MADDRWMIWSNQNAAWWKGSLHGYTLDLDEAGVFTRAEAEHATRGSIGSNGVPTSVILRAPDGTVARPQTHAIVQAARVLAASARTWSWDRADWPALVQLLAAVSGLPFPSRPLPRCPDCGHSNYHEQRDGCLSWEAHSASVVAPAGQRCRCRTRNDLSSPL